MNTCNATKAEKLIKVWTSYAIEVGCETDTDRSYQEVKDTIGYKQFIRQGEQMGLSNEHIADCWDLVKLNLLSIRSHRTMQVYRP